MEVREKAALLGVNCTGTRCRTLVIRCRAALESSPSDYSGPQFDG